MKELGLFIIGVVLLFSIVSFVSAEGEISDFCENIFPYQAECGTYSFQKTKVTCGTCYDGLCVEGKCYDFDDLGECMNIYEKYDYLEKPDHGISSCNNSNCLDFGFSNDSNGFCEWENTDIYTSKFYFKGDRAIPSSRLDSYDSTIYLEETDITNLESLNFPLTLVYETSRLPEGTEVTFEIYKTQKRGGFGFYGDAKKDNVDETIGKENKIASIKGSVEGGNAEVLWTLTGRDLLNFEYDGEIVFSYYIFVPNTDKVIFPGSTSVNEYGSITGIAGKEGQLILISKKGECSGDISCRYFSKFECQEIKEDVPNSDCIWSEKSSSCVGMNTIPCSIIGEEGICSEFDSCSWSYYSFWNNFKYWFKNLFG